MTAVSAFSVRAAWSAGECRHGGLVLSCLAVTAPLGYGTIRRLLDRVFQRDHGEQGR